MIEYGPVSGATPRNWLLSYELAVMFGVSGPST